MCEGPGVGPAVFTYTPADDTATGVVADNSNRLEA